MAAQHVRDEDILGVIARDAEAGTLNQFDLRALSFLCHRDPLGTANGVASALGLERVRAYRIIYKLDERGFVTRMRPDGEPDRRTVYFQPTERGRALNKRVEAALSRRTPRAVAAA